MDEATASLDVDSETQIQEAISELVSGKTVLVIAHRMRTIEAADQIVVLDKVLWQKKGNHDTLMKKNGLYRKLVDLQTEQQIGNLVYRTKGTENHRIIGLQCLFLSKEKKYSEFKFC